nr:serine/threonine-protein kinase [Corallococcus macrosporus]
MSVDALSAGTCIGPWEVLRRLAAGGYGTVYAVRRRDRPRSRQYALKLARHLDSPWFFREAEVLSRLRHPAVPRLVARGSWRPGAGAYPFLVMTYVDGESLYAWSQARNPSAREVGALLLQAAEVLAFAHGRGVLHRDFKGDNLRIQPGGRLTLLDWGAGWHPEVLPLTGTGQLPPGTAHYYSPQLHLRRMAAPSAQGPKHPSHSVADELYAVGVTFYRLLTETYPVSAWNAQVLRGAHGHAPDSPSTLNPHVPEDLASLITRLLAFAPEWRPASATALASELRHLLSRADETWDLPLFDWARSPSPQSRTTQDAPGMEGPVAPGQEVPLQHARLQRVDRLRRLRDARELRRRVPAHVARMEAKAIVAATPARRGQARWAIFRHVMVKAVAVMITAGLLWGLGVMQAPDAGESPTAASPAMAPPSGPDQAAAPGAAPPFPAPPPLEKEAMTLPQKQDRSPRARSLARTCTLAVGAASTLVACAGTPLKPAPQRCPQDALDAMKTLGLRRDGKAGITVDIRYPFRPDATKVTVGDGDIVSLQKEDYGRLPQGTLLYGRLWTGGERVVGHYTRAETPDGRVYPVCFILGNPEGWWKEEGSKPGAAIISRSAGYTVVDAFP